MTYLKKMLFEYFSIILPFLGYIVTIQFLVII